MYINDDDYLSYKYVVQNSDNYLVLTNQRRVIADYQNPEEINILVQYLEPSDLYYVSTQTIYQDRTFPQINTTSSDWSRSDISNVLICSFLIIILTVFVYNILSKIFVRGGFCR